MKSTHHTIRMAGLALGLALLMVTGTAAMIGSFSTPLPAGNQISLHHPMGTPPAAEVNTTAMTANADTVLYQRVQRGDGSAQWVLLEEPSTTLALRSNVETPVSSALVISSSGIQRVSYVLSAKPAGLSKAVKNCGSPTARLTSDVYDIRCHTVG